jgi:cytochrome b pre-mRNA-processing protein 3
MFAAIKRRRRLRAEAADLYAALVRQTRLPVFYRNLGVPDTFDGRFDLLVLHAFLLFRRLKGQGEESQELAQAVFDTMFADMDNLLRESGVGDLSIGRKVRGMSDAFYGRLKAYDEALAEGEGVLAAALARNVYAGAEAGDGAQRLARYAQAAGTALSAASLETLASGTLVFPMPEAPAS